MSIFRPRIQQVWRMLEFAGILTSTWPPESKTRARGLSIRNIAWCLAVLNLIASMVPLALNIFLQKNTIVVLMKALSELNALIEALLNLILCRLQWPKLQRLLQGIQDFVQFADERQKAVLQKYVDRYSGFYIFVAASYITTAIVFSCGPLLSSASLPAEGWYPFPVDTPVRRTVLYVTQVVAILQTGIGITVDFMIAMFFWYSTARLDMLRQHLGKVKTASNLNLCIRTHQEIINFVEETQNTVRYLICKTNVTMALAVVFGAFPLVYNQTLIVIVQFACMVIGGCQTLYITAWPADDLREISGQIGTAAYGVDWVGKSERFSKSVLFMVQRSQRALHIRMGALFPVLSLEYYSNFLKTISSYFMTMRTVVGK